MKKMICRIVVCGVLLFANNINVYAQKTLRECGFPIGIFDTGKNNAITDVHGVKVGQITCIEGDSIRTGVTAIVPHSGNIFRNKVPAAIYVGNGFGKLAGYTQVKELGNIETPIILTNGVSKNFLLILKPSLNTPKTLFQADCTDLLLFILNNINPLQESTIKLNLFNI